MWNVLYVGMQDITTWVEVPGFDSPQWLHTNKQKHVARHYSTAREIFIECIQIIYKFVSLFPHEMVES
jgi:hypothetical protein